MPRSEICHLSISASPNQAVATGAARPSYSAWEATPRIGADSLPTGRGRAGIPEPDDSGSEPCSDAVQAGPQFDCGNSARLSYKIPKPQSKPLKPGSIISSH